MKLKKYIILCLITSLTGGLSAQKTMTGIEVLKKDNFKILEGKRVGLITNPTGVDNSLKSTIDILFEAPNVNLVALYGPEHGVRGDVHAGDKVENSTDPSTGLPVYSLYGKTRKPTPEMLQGIDVLVYDIQDIGCRSFTTSVLWAWLWKRPLKTESNLSYSTDPTPSEERKWKGISWKTVTSLS